MKALLAAVLALATLPVLANDANAIEAGKRLAKRDFRELQDPQFRSLKLRYSIDGKAVLLCGEISGRNRPEFTKFWVWLEPKAGDLDNRRPPDFPEKIWDELVDAICAPGP